MDHTQNITMKVSVTRIKSVVLVTCLLLQIYLAGQERQSYWETSTAQEVGIDPDVIQTIHLDIKSGQYGLIDHFLIIRHGKLIADYSYRQDYDTVMKQYDTTDHQYNYDHTNWHPFYRNTRLHTLQSVTKSVTSILLGIAKDEGLIKDEFEKVMPYFKSYLSPKTDISMSSMTIQDLLTMRSGIQWDEANYDEANNSCILMEASEDWIQFVLDHPMDEQPGNVFEYNSGASVLLGKIVREATGQRIDEWAEDKLFGPLGIEEYYWKVTPKGEIDTEGGLYLSSQSLAKLGYMMLHKGKWEGHQIVSEHWVDQSLHPWVNFQNDAGYGYQWWLPEHAGGKVKIFAGNGYGGQFLMVAPEFDLIVVFNGWNIHDRPEKSSYDVLQNLILPACK